MVICRNPNCAKENPDNIVFCKYCGRRLKEPKNQSKLPLRMVGILGGFILLIIITKMIFSGQGNVNKPIDPNARLEDGTIVDQVIDNTLKYN